MAITVTDDFTGTTGAAWNATTWPIVRNHHGTSPLPTIQSNTGRHTLAGGGTSAQACFTAPTLTDCEIRVVYTPITSARIYPEIGWRVGNNVSTGQPDQGYAIQWVTEIGVLRLVKIQSYDWFVQTGGAPVATSGSWNIYIRAKGARHRVKIWAVGDTEPATWLLDGSDPTYTSGRVYIGGWNNEAEEAATFAWDSFSLLELLPPPPGIYIDGQAVVAVNAGTTPVVAAYQGGTPIPVP